MDIIYQIFTIDETHTEHYVRTWSHYNKAMDEADSIAEGYRLSKKLLVTQIGRVNYANRTVWTVDGEPIVTLIIRKVEH